MPDIITMLNFALSTTTTLFLSHKVTFLLSRCVSFSSDRVGFLKYKFENKILPLEGKKEVFSWSNSLYIYWKGGVLLRGSCVSPIAIFCLTKKVQWKSVGFVVIFYHTQVWVWKLWRKIIVLKVRCVCELWSMIRSVNYWCVDWHYVLLMDNSQSNLITLW